MNSLQSNPAGAAISRQAAVLNVRQMGEADRLAVAAGVDTNELMEHAGWAVKAEIEQRWSSFPVFDQEAK